jgi:hypothetical protein
MNNKHESIIRQVPFVFEAEALERRCRKSRRKLYRSLASVEIERIVAAEVAYTVEVGPDEAVDVLLHRGRLMWPLKYSAPFRSLRTGDMLQRLLNGELDLFSDGKLATTVASLENDPSNRKVIWSGEDEARAMVARKISTCAVVDDELFAQGGVPILVGRNPGIYPIISVASSGASRSAELHINGLAIQPGGFHQWELQEALFRGTFSIHFADDKEVPKSYPRVTAHYKHSTDSVDLRIDAAFRIVWEDIKKIPASNDSAFEWIRSKFKDALSASLLNLSEARCKALHAILASSYDIPSPTRRVVLQAILLNAADAAKTITPDAYRNREAAIEDAYLASLANIA